MTDLFGSTRSVVKQHYALLTPAGFVKSALPGWSNAEVVVALAPRIGARFSQLLLTLLSSGSGSGTTGPNECLVFVLDGNVRIQYANNTSELDVGGYGYLPPQTTYSISATNGEARLLLFQRAYVPLAGYDAPTSLFGNEKQVTGTPFMGDETATLKTLLPEIPAFDMAVNIFTFMPGVTLPMVETHIMEHGLLMIAGQGIYRLGEDWHPVQNGDVIWMAPYCPQWFVATGKTPARYIYYKDIHRDPLI